MDSLPEKPRYKEPCNGCGLCCAVALCEVGKMLFESAPCPALRTDGKRTFCSLVLVEEAAGMEPILRTSLGIGDGCSMED